MSTKSELTSRVANDLGISNASAKSVIDNFIDAIASDLAAGVKVQIAGLGTFEVKQTAARKGRNPATGEAIDIPASKKVAYKAASDLKAKL